MGRAELFLRALELVLGDVDRDDRAGSRDLGTGNGSHAHTAQADDGDGLAALDLAGIHRGPQAGHHATAHQARSRRIRPRVHLGALPLMDQGLLCERADAQGGLQLGAIGQRHLLRGVESIEAVLRLALLAGTALAAHRAPVQDHIIAHSDVSDVLADLRNYTRSLMAQQEGIVVRNTAIAVGQVGVAHAAGLHLHNHVVGPRGGDLNIHYLHRVALAARDNRLNALCHAFPPAVSKFLAPRRSVFRLLLGRQPVQRGADLHFPWWHNFPPRAPGGCLAGIMRAPRARAKLIPVAGL